jgi:SAM-dependent methyltransferase
VNVIDRMRAEWNRRAAGDAHFYVAFGRQNQAEEDFLSSAAEVMPMFEREFPRLPPAPASERRALEIGCGPGRLMIPMSRRFGEIHGVDVSDDMVALARQRLREIPSAHVHATSGDGLGLFPDAHFDFIYSYIVFQHIPSREIVLNYLREARRVLKPGGVLCCQLRGTAPLASEMSRESETWTGCHFNAGEMAHFAREQAFPLVEISGLDTQYMWTTFRKPGLTPNMPARIRVKAVTAANGPEPRVPARGPDAAISLWIDGMPESASLADCAVWFGNREQLGCYLSPVAGSGGCQLNARLPGGLLPGDYEVQLRVCGEPMETSYGVTVMEPPPRKPRVLSVTDGINITSRYRVETGGAKVVIEDVDCPAEVSFLVAGRAPEFVQYECRDPITATYEFAFHLAHKTPRGRTQALNVRVDGREIGPIDLEVL